MIVDSLTSNTKSSNPAVFLDRNMNLRIKTDQGLNFNGYLKGDFPSD